MRLCAYWDCMEEVDEGTSFCREHGMKLNRQLIDKCPKCGRYKDVRQKLCPDCNYGRPVAGWKVSSRNLDDVKEYVEFLPSDDSNRYQDTPYSYDRNRNNAPSRGEAMCPSCGSSSLTYKSAFDYYRCNDCETTFITPVYSYGEIRGKIERDESSRPVNRNISREPVIEQPPPGRIEQPPPRRIEQPPVRREEPVFEQYPPARWEEPQAPVNRISQPVHREPDLTTIRRYQAEERAMNEKALKIRGQGGKLGWLYLFIVLCIVVLAALLCWLFFGSQIADLLSTLPAAVNWALT